MSVKRRHLRSQLLLLLQGMMNSDTKVLDDEFEKMNHDTEYIQ